MAKADHPDAVIDFGETQNVQALVERYQRDVANLSVIAAVIDVDDRRGEIEISCSFERQASITNAARILCWIEVDAH